MYFVTMHKPGKAEGYYRSKHIEICKAVYLVYFCWSSLLQILRSAAYSLAFLCSYVHLLFSDITTATVSKLTVNCVP